VNEDDRLLTADEIATWLAVPVSWVHESARAGSLPSLQIGRYRRFRHDDVTAWLDTCKRGGRPIQFRARQPGGP
jgi:excisionase family DNA binding protein